MSKTLPPLFPLFPLFLFVMPKKEKIYIISKNKIEQ